mgnify:CR=1 FL=1|tara:strand:+ start:1041 stop:1826 length:786 start_codon:yes stop_codon:yes gene_type:complete
MFNLNKLLILFVFFVSCDSDNVLYVPLGDEEVTLPYYSEGEEIVSHTAYTLSYSEEHEQALWVAYTLTSEQASADMERTDDYRQDPAIENGSASLNDYSGSGYDRGHLAPAGDMEWDETVMSESFFLSNMSPQLAGFNRYIWKDLEADVRDAAKTNGKIHIVTGPVFGENYPILGTIGENNVSVPSHYYKVVLDYTEPVIKAIGFILANESSDQALSSFAKSIDEVEQETGINFFHMLPDSIENDIESTVNLNDWFGYLFE